MIREGQIVLFTFPQTDRAAGKARPALVLRSVPGPHDDWLICMISTRLHQEVPQVDEIICDSDPDFPQTGLKATSLIRVTRLAVVSADLLHGAIGSLADQRLTPIRTRLALWMSGTPAVAPAEEEGKPQHDTGDDK